MTMFFDVLAAKKVLEKAGFESVQADGMCEAISMGYQGDLATKADIDSLESRIDSKIDGKIDSLVSRINSKIDSLEVRLMKIYVGGLAIFMVTTIAAMTFISGLVSMGGAGS